MANDNASSIKHIVKITGILMLITTLTAVLLAVINMMTEPVIEENTKRAKQEAVYTLFPEADSMESVKDVLGDAFPKSITDLYVVFQGSEIIGYAADAASMGFNDVIGMMIGVNYADNTIRGIQILSITDTPGVGMKVADAAYLASYEGLGYPVTFDAGTYHADAISGATYSSKGILNGVNDVLEFCAHIVANNTMEGEGNDHE